MDTLTQPNIMKSAFCTDGTKNTIPLENTDPLNPQLADFKNGFPVDTQGDPADGKLPPERADFNALGYLVSLYSFYLQCGGTFTFDSTTSTNIGGYPAGARLWYTNDSGVSMILRSTVDNNTDNFITNPSVIGSSWVIESMLGIDNDSISLLDYKFSDKTINKMSWVLSDGSWLSGSVYTQVITHLKEDVAFMPTNTPSIVVGSNSAFASGTYTRDSSSDFVDDGTTYYAWSYDDGNDTHTFYVIVNVDAMSGDDAYSALQGQRIYAKDGNDAILTTHKIVKTIEENDGTNDFDVLIGSDGHRIIDASAVSSYEALYNSVGVAWYYVLDTVNNRFKLPRTKWNFVGSRGNVGAYVAESLPNITGAIGFRGQTSGWYSGCVYGRSDIPGGTWDSTSLYAGTAYIDASRSSSSYKNGANVQQRATEMYLYFYVGGFNDTATQQTAGINASTINSKADIDLGNVTSQAKTDLITLGEPDWDSAIQITLPYTTPSNGYIVRNVLTNSYIHLNIGSTGIKSFAGASSNNVSVYLPTKKGVEYTLDVSHGTWYLYFVPCIGG